jgi:hypothetical protein
MAVMSGDIDFVRNRAGERTSLMRNGHGYINAIKRKSPAGAGLGFQRVLAGILYVWVGERILYEYESSLR